VVCSVRDPDAESERVCDHSAAKSQAFNFCLGGFLGSGPSRRLAHGRRRLRRRPSLRPVGRQATTIGSYLAPDRVGARIRTIVASHITGKGAYPTVAVHRQSPSWARIFSAAAFFAKREKQARVNKEQQMPFRTRTVISRILPVAGEERRAVAMAGYLCHTKQDPLRVVAIGLFVG